MVTINGLLARKFRALLRRAGMGKMRGQPETFVQFISGPDGLRLRTVGPGVAIEYRQSDKFDAGGFFLPVSVLETVEGRTNDPVMIDWQEQRALIAWTDHGVPRQTECLVEKLPNNIVWPELPTVFTPNPASLWDALRDAAANTDRQATRYALNCLQLRGSRGDIIATDGKHVLLQRGYQWPWRDDILLPVNGTMGWRELAGQAVEVGMAGDWVSFRVGDWTISIKIDHNGRFPRVDDLIRPADSASSRLVVSASDAEFLGRALHGLPCDDDYNSPVTVELNGRVVVRAKEERQTRPTDLVLGTSSLAGKPVAVCTNRRFLQRALQLGFRTVHVFGNDTPVLCQDDHRTYLWALLDKQSAIPASDDAIVTASPVKPVTHFKPTIHRRSPTVSTQPQAQTVEPKVPTAAPRQKRVRAGSGIDQAVALRDGLRTAAMQAGELVRSLKQQKRQARIVTNTLASLKQLQKVAG